MHFRLAMVRTVGRLFLGCGEESQGFFLAAPISDTKHEQHLHDFDQLSGVGDLLKRVSLAAWFRAGLASKAHH